MQKGATMNTFLNIDWTEVLAVVGGLAVGAFMLVLIAYIQLWRPDVRYHVRDWRARNW
jgi:hypothetical protein